MNARRRDKGFLMGLLPVILLLWPSTLSGARPAYADDRELDQAIRFRAEFGLRSDLAFVAETFQQRAAFPDDLWGLPLSQSEADELRRRMQIREDMTLASRYAIKDPDYAGIFIDQKNAGRPVFMFKGGTQRQQTEIASMLPPGTTVDIRTVDRSYADLETLQARIEAAKEELAREGITVMLTGISPSTNSVVVGIENLTAEMVGVLNERFGAGLSVRDEDPGIADACISVSNCWPAKGGIKMYWALDSSRYCTTGWIGKRSDMTKYVVVTAGHCLEVNGGSGGEWRHNGNQIGTALNETWSEGANADVGLVQTSTSGTPATKNQVLATPPSLVTSVVGVRDSSEQFQGDAVCRVGATSDRDCGTITVVDVANPSCVGATCKTINHTKEVSFDSTGGDSGGPVFQYTPASTVIAYGTHVHSTADGIPGAHGWYSTITWGRVTYSGFFGYSYSICLTSAC